MFCNQLIINGFGELSVETKHFYELVKMPFHHCDPFDRLMIAQAISEKMPVVSIDAAFDNYSVTRLW